MLSHGSSITSAQLCQASGLLTKDTATVVEIALDDREDVLSKVVVGVVVLAVADGVSVYGLFSVDVRGDVRGVAVRRFVDEVDFVA